MRLIFFLIGFVTGVPASVKCVTEREIDARFDVLETTVSKILAEMANTQTTKCQHDLDLEKRLRVLEVKMTDIQGPEDDTGTDSNIFEMGPQLNDTNLEERVQALEFQMVNVHDDITSLNTGLFDLNEDVEAQFVLVEERDNGCKRANNDHL